MAIDKKIIMGITYKIYQEGEDTGRKVTVYYDKGNIEKRTQVITDLKEDYPTEFGYALIKESEKPAF